MKTKNNSSHHSLFLGGLFGLTIFVVMFAFGNAQLVIPTSLSNAFITIQQILLSSDGLDTPSNIHKVNIYADGSESGTMVVDGGLKVTGLGSSGSNYLVRTDSNGLFSLIDASILSGMGGGGSSASGQWLDSSVALSGLYYTYNVGVGYESDNEFALHVSDSDAALRISTGAIKVDPFGAATLEKGPGVVTSNAAGILSVSKVVENMVDTGFLATLQPVSLWQGTPGSDIYYTGGNVGILTSNPLTTLFVSGDALSARMYVVNGQSTFTNTGSDAYWFGVNDIVIGAPGNRVAIGGISPLYPFHVNGTTYIDSNIVDTSGLKFAQLTSGSVASANLSDVGCKSLSVDSDGNVILVNGGSSCATTGGNGVYTVNEICGPCTTANGNVVVKYTMLYSGPNTVSYEVRNPIAVVASGSLLKPGDKISFHGTGSYWQFADTVINIYTDSGSGFLLNGTLSSECGSPVEPGNVFGDFTIIAALTNDQSIVCPLPGFTP